MTGSEWPWVAFIRHGPTEWNDAGRIQGHTDVPLSEAGRVQVLEYRVPADYRRARWVASPLERARETARLMLGAEPEIEPALKEMNWGQWEGCTPEDLRARWGTEISGNEQRGLDFKPAGGESPRELRTRLASWLQSIALTARPHFAVTHKGVIRAALSLATGWDMRCDPPLRLRWDCAHVFWLHGRGNISVREVNVRMQ